MRSFLPFLLLPLASAHFHLNYPADRGDTEVTQAQSPCGGINTPSKNRAPWPLTGGQISIETEHAEAETAVYLALGNNPKAEDFTIILKDPFLEIGIGTFCWNDLPVPKNISVKDGDNATIQIVQGGHTSGGLYNCVDITFTSAAVNVPTCKNGTGVTAQTATGSANPSASGNASVSATGSAATATKSASAAEEMAKIASGALVAGVVGVATWFL